MELKNPGWDGSPTELDIANWPKSYGYHGPDPFKCCICTTIGGDRCCRAHLGETMRMMTYFLTWVAMEAHARWNYKWSCDRQQDWWSLDDCRGETLVEQLKSGNIKLETKHW